VNLRNLRYTLRQVNTTVSLNHLSNHLTYVDNSTEQALESGLEANKKDTVPEPSIEASASVLMEEEDHAQLATDLLESEWPGPSQYFDQRLYELTTTEPEWGYPRDTTEHFNSRGLSDVF